MRRYCSYLALAALLLPRMASAYIPVTPSPELGWHGPGYICEAHFTLRVLEGEYVTEDPQWELWYPISNTIRSDKGWFSILQLPDRGNRLRNAKRLQASQRGIFYRVPPIDPTQTTMSFVYAPRDRSEGIVEIDFWKATSSGPHGSYRQENYHEGIERIDFAANPKPDCLNKRK